MMVAARHPPAKTVNSALSPEDWNFDAVPDTELVACGEWEYARESAFIRDVRRRCLENWRAGGPCDLDLYTDIQKLQSIEYRAEVFLRGYFFEPDVVYQSADADAPHYRHPKLAPMAPPDYGDDH